MNKDMYSEARPLMKSLQILNIYQLNLFQIVLFMFKLKNETIPQIFHSQFTAINHKYPTRHSLNNYTLPKTTLRKTDFSITYRGPNLWNRIPSKDMKNLVLIDLFKAKLKKLLLNSVNEISFF